MDGAIAWAHVYFGSHIAVPVLAVVEVVASPPAPPLPPVVVVVVPVVVPSVAPPVPVEPVVVSTVQAPSAKAASAPKMTVTDRWFMLATSSGEKRQEHGVKDGGNVAHRHAISTAASLDSCSGEAVVPAEIGVGG
jgi:hypothetical protein